MSKRERAAQEYKNQNFQGVQRWWNEEKVLIAGCCTKCNFLAANVAEV